MSYSAEALIGDTAQVQHSEYDQFGSGRLIGRNLILTTRHVVTPRGREVPEKRGWRVRLIAGKPKPAESVVWTWIEAEVAWFGKGSLDLALLTLLPTVGLSDWIPNFQLRIGRIEQLRSLNAFGLGFPRGAKADDKRRLLIVSGKLKEEGNVTLSFGVEMVDQPEYPREDWHGFSGGSVLLEESPRPNFVWIYGVAQQVPRAFTNRLEVARLDEAWKDQEFRKVLMFANIPLEPPEDPFTSAEFPQPELVKADAYSTNLFFYASRKIEFFGRQLEMQRLEEFLAYPTQFAWYLITGAGGAGKSRLALEFCLRIGGTWNAGFVKKRWLTQALWQGWRPSRPTLLVFDDSAAYAEELGELARFLGTETFILSPVRLLLIEREKKSWFDRFMGKGARDREQILATQYPKRASDPLVIGQLAEVETLQLIRSITGAQSASEIKSDQQLIRLLRRLDSEERPLFASFLAATHLTSLDDPLAVMREILDYERTRWDAAGSTENDKRLLVVATICAGIANPTGLGSFSLLEMFMQGFSASRYQLITGKTTGTTLLAPLQPDILGELFVLDWVETSDQAEVALMLNTAWSLNEEAFGAFLLRTVIDFPEHGALRRITKGPEVNSAARSVWSSVIVDLLRDMPAHYLNLGVALYEEIKSLTLLHPNEAVLYEHRARASHNLMTDFHMSGESDQAGLQYMETEALLSDHPDKERGAEGQGRLLVYNIQRCKRENDVTLARPLPATPFTFANPMSRLDFASEQYESLSSLCKLHPGNVYLRNLAAEAAFEFVSAHCMILLASTRLSELAVVTLNKMLQIQVEGCEQLFTDLDAMLSRYPRVAQTDLFLGQSASMIIAMYSELERSEKLKYALEVLCKRGNTIKNPLSYYQRLYELTSIHPNEPEFRKEQARAAWNLLRVAHHFNRLSEARQFYEKLCVLTKDHPNELAIKERKDRAEQLLEQCISEST